MNTLDLLKNAHYMDILNASCTKERIDMFIGDVEQFYTQHKSIPYAILNACLIRAIAATESDVTINYPYLKSVLKTFTSRKIFTAAAAVSYLENSRNHGYKPRKKRTGVIPDWYDEKEFEDLLNSGN